MRWGSDSETAMTGLVFAEGAPAIMKAGLSSRPLVDGVTIHDRAHYRSRQVAIGFEANGRGARRIMTTLGMEPLFVVEDKDNQVFTGLASGSGFRGVINRIDEVSENTQEKGDLFEKLAQAFIRQDKARSERFSHVWLWNEWPGRNNRPDTGIDLNQSQSGMCICRVLGIGPRVSQECFGP